MPVSISTEKCGQVRAALAAVSNSSHASNGAAGSAISMSLRCLHRPRVGQQLVWGQQQVVAHAKLRLGLAGKQPAPFARLDDGILGRSLRLAVKQVGDGGHGVKLVLSGWRRIAVSWCLPSDRLEAGDALGLEYLHGVGLQLVVAGKALVQEDHPFRLSLGNRPDQVERQFPLQADDE